MHLRGIITAALITATTITVSSCTNTTDDTTPPPGTASATTPTQSSPATSPAGLLSLADVCPLIQNALDDNFTGDAFPPPQAYRQFAQDIDTIRNQTDPQGRNILTTLAQTSQQVATDIEQAGDTLDAFAVRQPWFTAMDDVSQTCRDQGAPLA